MTTPRHLPRRSSGLVLLAGVVGLALFASGLARTTPAAARGPNRAASVVAAPAARHHGAPPAGRASAGRAVRNRAPLHSQAPAAGSRQAALARSSSTAGPQPRHGKAPSYRLVNVGAFGGEPSITANGRGELYDTTPSGGTILYRSVNGGSTWTKAATADPASGDDCVFTDQANGLYLCNLAGSKSTAPLQADVWKSLNDGRSWTYGNNRIDAGGHDACGTSCSPFGVDRDWGAAYIPRGGNTGRAEVVLMYHDFYGPSSIWVNMSRDGGKSFGPPENVLANFTSTAGDQAAVAAADSACNTVPAGAAIARGGRHPGRIYVAWIASDPESPATGCNVTMVQSFHNLFVAWSDNGGATWTPQLAFDAGLGHDASTPFVSFTIDAQGNPYFAFTAPGPADDPAVCAAESTAGKVQTDPSCAYHAWVVWSPNGGSTWDGGGGSIPGSAATAYEVDPSAKRVTDVYPAIAAGRPGEVDVAWLGTNEIEPTDPLGKFDPGGCAGPGPANGNPTFYPPACRWNLFAAQSLDLPAGPRKATWAQGPVTVTPMHVGDICNLGIFCVAPASNRHLLDFISETISPTTGCAHVAYTDDYKVNKLRVANQTSGPNVLGLRSGPCADRGPAVAGTAGLSPAPASVPSTPAPVPSTPASVPPATLPVVSAPAAPAPTAGSLTDRPRRL